MIKIIYFLKWFSLSVLLLIIDQGIKIITLKKFPKGEFFIFKHFLSIKVLKNPNLAFSIPCYNFIAIILITIAIILITYYFLKNFLNYSFLINLSFTMIIAGSASNLIDRFLRNGVIDYVDFSFWTNFNLADIYISAGILFLIYKIIKSKTLVTK